VDAFRRITYRLPADREDDFAAWLGMQGCLGCSVLPVAGDIVRLTAYFPEGSAFPGAAEVAAWDANLETSERLDDADWLAPYRAASVPFDVGRRFRIDPREPEDPVRPASSEAAEGRSLLSIPARTAFGTGSHESTRLCVLWLEDLASGEDLSRLRVLDVGTGSGILAFCAERLGVRRIAGYDLDSAAVLVAQGNARRNGCRPTLWAGTLDSVAPAARFDLALVNVLPERILDAYPALVEHLADGARVISSGNLVERRDELLRSFAGMGLKPVGEKRDGEWLSFLLRKYPSP
jgi:ribosomal protein L11 methyltransferase